MPAGSGTSAASSAPASTPAPDALRVSRHRSKRTAVVVRRSRPSRRHPDPWRDADVQTNVDEMARSLEARGRTPAQARLRRRFLRFIPVGSGEKVLEVGCGTGVVVRDLAALVGRRGEVVGIDASRRLLDRARALCREAARRSRVALRVGDGARLPFAADRFDVALAITVILHVADPLRVVREMARVTRPGGRVGVQDQDFGVVAVTHPDRALTERYQDTTLEPWTKTFLERRAERAVRFGIVDVPTAERWLDGFTEVIAAHAFVLTLIYYGAVAT